MEKLSRRAAIVGAITSATALAIPAVAALPEPDLAAGLTGFDRVNLLAMQLAAAMNEINPGHWVSTARPQEGYALVHKVAS